MTNKPVFAENSLENGVPLFISVSVAFFLAGVDLFQLPIWLALTEYRSSDLGLGCGIPVEIIMI